MERPPARPEGALIRLTRQASGMTVPEAVKRSGVSKARWSQVESGYETRNGVTRPVQVKPDTLARMARAVGLSPERLESEGQRPDAAEILREILRSQPEGPRLSPVPDPAPPLDLSTADDALIGMFIEAWREDTEDDRRLKEALRRTWQLYTVAKGDRGTVVDALAALLHRGVPRLYLRERAREEGRESS